jgi:hypothetical protein
MSRSAEHLAGNAAGSAALEELSRTRHLVRSIFGPTLRFLKFLAARIDLSHFPGSCCG